jgi:hypothetical protein
VSEEDRVLAALAVIVGGIAPKRPSHRFVSRAEWLAEMERIGGHVTTYRDKGWNCPLSAERLRGEFGG